MYYFLIKGAPLGSSIKWCAFRSEGSHFSKSMKWTQQQYYNSTAVYYLKVTFNKEFFGRPSWLSLQNLPHMPLANRTPNGSNILPSPIWQREDELTLPPGWSWLVSTNHRDTFTFAKDWGSKKFDPFLAKKTLEVSVKRFPGSLQWKRGWGSLFVCSVHENNGKAAKLESRSWSCPAFVFTLMWDNLLLRKSLTLFLSLLAQSILTNSL